jgi:predicted metallo-beta-lactamase superfamily hydrolase
MITNYLDLTLLNEQLELQEEEVSMCEIDRLIEQIARMPVHLAVEHHAIRSGQLDELISRCYDLAHDETQEHDLVQLREKISNVLTLAPSIVTFAGVF